VSAFAPIISFYLVVAAVYVLYDSWGRTSATWWRNYIDYLLPSAVRKKSSFRLDVYWALLSFTKIPGMFGKFLMTVTYLNMLPALLRSLSITDSSSAKWLQDHLATMPGHDFILFLVALLAFDFGTYYAHRITHESLFLWQFHKAHHYAEQLNYFAGGRTHPFDSFFSFNLGIIFMAIAVAFLAPVDDAVFSGPHLYASHNEWFYYALVFIPGFVNQLNHSHFPITFGPIIERIFVSPAFHLRHHSKQVRNMNYGQMFSIWDCLFGTAILPSADKEVEHRNILGVDDLGDRYYANIFQWLYKPFLDAGAVLMRRVGKIGTVFSSRG